MGIILGFFGVLIVVAILLALFAIGEYNGLVTLRNRFKNAFAQIDVQLKRRYDLIPNLVETAKGYMKHESGTLEAVTQARNLAQTAGTRAASNPGDPQSMKDLAGAEAGLTGALGRLLAVAEAYPDLKAHANFQQLQTELGDIENKIAAARRFFNNAAAEYNAARESFPNVLYAGGMGFGPQDFFTVEESERAAVNKAPQVKF